MYAVSVRLSPIPPFPPLLPILFSPITPYTLIAYSLFTIYC